MTRWEKQSSGAEYFYSGDVVFGCVYQLSLPPRNWCWVIQSVLLPRSWANRGKRASLSEGKRQVENIFQRWLGLAELEPVKESEEGPR